MWLLRRTWASRQSSNMIVADVAARMRHAPFAAVMRMFAGGCRWYLVLNDNGPPRGAIDQNHGRRARLSPHRISVVLVLGPLRPHLQA